MSVEIPLTNGGVSLVDIADVELVNQHRWFRRRSNRGRTFYATSTAHVGSRQIHMHRLILQPEPYMQIDHKNGDGLDNRRSNIRVATQAENNRNRQVISGVSRYKGVSLCNGPRLKSIRWMSGITYNNKTVYLGIFPNEIDAALAYDEKAKELFGEFAFLNF